MCGTGPPSPVIASGGDLVQMLDSLVLHRDNIKVLILSAEHPEVGLPRFWAILRISLPPKVAIMALAGGSDEELLEFLFAVRVAGLFPPDTPPEELSEAIVAVAAGQIMIHPLHARRLRNSLALPPDRQGILREGRSYWDSNSGILAIRGKRVNLTPRENEVLGLVSEGKTNREIALALGIRPRTAAFHVSNILRKSVLASR